MLYVEGRVEVRNDSSQIIVQEAALLEEMDAKRKESVYIRVKEENHTQELLEQVKRILSMHSGEADVYLYYEKQKDDETSRCIQSSCRSCCDFPVKRAAR